jgi:Ni/Fe-hydrogenase subunit HybB-like protein
MTTHVHPRPIGGELLDGPVKALLGVFAVAAVVISYRFVAGVGAVSNMNDGYTWGIWEPVNVVVFTGIGAGAYSVGLLCYLLNRGKYHPLVRPAVLLGAIAYSLGGASIIVALGRYWNIYWLALPGMWNLSSVLLEVAVCVIAYVLVLWIEVLPAVLERAAAKGGSWAARAGARLAVAMPYIIALAMLLPTMHQSSLGGLMLVAGPKLHPLWHTALLPLLAFLSCLSMGIGTVVVLTTVMEHTWNAKRDRELLTDMSKVNGGLLLLYAAIRLADILLHGKARYLARPDWHLFFFVLELALFVVPAIILFVPRLQRRHGWLVAGGALSVIAGALWRVDTFLTCYDAGEGWTYVPSFGEIAVTVGMAAVGIAVFIVVSKLFPVVVVEDARRPAGRPASTAEGEGLRRRTAEG